MGSSEPIPAAVVGAGSFGRHHARVYAALPEAELVAIVDKDPERASEIAGQFGCLALSDAASLPPAVRAVSLAVPTQDHVRVALPLLEKGVDLLVEKPIAAEVAGAESLLQTAERLGRIVQVGHLERFNPAVEEATKVARLPLFFEIHRMSPFSPRSLDIDVVLDLMIHDIDVVLSLVDAETSQVSASGLSVISNQTDIANARIQFDNGCVANLTASRVSTEKIRKLRFFQPREYVSVDYVTRQGVRIGLDGAAGLRVQPLAPADREPLMAQLKSFLTCVRERSRPRVDASAGLAALRLAIRIKAAIEEHSHLVSKTLSAQR